MSTQMLWCRCADSGRMKMQLSDSDTSDLLCILWRFVAWIVQALATLDFAYKRAVVVGVYRYLHYSLFSHSPFTNTASFSVVLMPLVVTAFGMLPTKTFPRLSNEQDNEQDPFSTILEDYKDFAKALMTIQKDEEDEEGVPRETKGRTRYPRPAPLGDRTNVQEIRERERPFVSSASPNILTYAEAASKRKTRAIDP